MLESLMGRVLILSPIWPIVCNELSALKKKKVFFLYCHCYKKKYHFSRGLKYFSFALYFLAHIKNNKIYKNMDVHVKIIVPSF